MLLVRLVCSWFYSFSCSFVVSYTHFEPQCLPPLYFPCSSSRENQEHLSSRLPDVLDCGFPYIGTHDVVLHTLCPLFNARCWVQTLLCSTFYSFVNTLGVCTFSSRDTFCFPTDLIGNIKRSLYSLNIFLRNGGILFLLIFIIDFVYFFFLYNCLIVSYYNWLIVHHYFW